METSIVSVTMHPLTCIQILANMVIQHISLSLALPVAAACPQHVYISGEDSGHQSHSFKDEFRDPARYVFGLPIDFTQSSVLPSSVCLPLSTCCTLILKSCFASPPHAGCCGNAAV